ncbi:hypothetical protein GQ44DRAFT_733555 [Phaeosphaeriaceae sp. PMI808]|nr:hypothetical protein GQ44DRAFT_733555 [Phaeosphaeriaceae sp. PMI808]
MAGAETTLPSVPVQRPALLCLPAELRNQIWKCALSGTVFEVYCWPSYSAEKIATRILNRQKNFLSLLRACHQIYDEAKLFPFTFNAFRIKSEEGYSKFLERFDTQKREAIAEVHLVTFRAKHMVDGLGYFPKPITHMLALQKLPGLRRLCLEVRVKANCRGCRPERCDSCNPGVELAENHVKEYIAKQNERIEVLFKRLYYASVVASQVL